MRVTSIVILSQAPLKRCPVSLLCQMEKVRQEGKKWSKNVESMAAWHTAPHLALRFVPAPAEMFAKICKAKNKPKHVKALCILCRASEPKALQLSFGAWVVSSILHHSKSTKMNQKRRRNQK